MKKYKNKIKLNNSDLNSLSDSSMSSFLSGISLLYLINFKKKNYIPLTETEKFIDDYCFVDYDFITRILDKYNK